MGQSAQAPRHQLLVSPAAQVVQVAKAFHFVYFQANQLTTLVVAAAVRDWVARPVGLGWEVPVAWVEVEQAEVQHSVPLVLSTPAAGEADWVALMETCSEMVELDLSSFVGRRRFKLVLACLGHFHSPVLANYALQARSRTHRGKQYAVFVLLASINRCPGKVHAWRVLRT